MADATKLTDEQLLAIANAAPIPSGVKQMSNEQLRAAAGLPPISATEDVAKSIGTGVVKGGATALGTAGDIRDVTSGGFNYLMGKAGVSPETTQGIGEGVKKALGYTTFGKALALAPTSAQTMDVVNKAAAPFGGLHEPQTPYGEFGQTFGSFLPALAVPGGQGGLLRRAGQYALAPALLSEGAGQYFKGSPLEPWARAGGALLGPTVAGRAITPFGMSPEREAMAKILAGEGVTSLTAGQKTGSPRLRWMESAFSGGPAANAQSKAGEELTAAVMRKAGSGERLATPEAVAANAKRLSDTYDDLLSRVVVRPDPQMGNDMGMVLNTYAKALTSEQKKKVGEYASDIIDKFNVHGGAMPGDVYKLARSDINRIYKNNIGKDNDYAFAMKGLRDSLDNAMRRSAPPDIADSLKALDREYVAHKTVQNIMGTAAGEGAPFGYVTPANLRRAATSGGGKDFYAKGEGMFTPLARASTALMSPLPSSGTAERLMPALFAAIGGGGTHLAGGGPIDAILGAASSSVIPSAASRAIMNPVTQRYLGNNLLAQDPMRIELARALMAGNPKIQEQLGPLALPPQ